MSTYTGVTNFQNSRFFGPPCINEYLKTQCKCDQFTKWWPAIPGKFFHNHRCNRTNHLARAHSLISGAMSAWGPWPLTLSVCHKPRYIS